jgi:hypothetical protein
LQALMERSSASGLRRESAATQLKVIRLTSDYAAIM